MQAYVCKCLNDERSIVITSARKGTLGRTLLRARAMPARVLVQNKRNKVNVGLKSLVLDRKLKGKQRREIETMIETFGTRCSSGPWLFAGRTKGLST